MEADGAQLLHPSLCHCSVLRIFESDQRKVGTDVLSHRVLSREPLALEAAL